MSDLDERLGRTMNDFALLVARMRGVGDVAVSGSRLLVSMLDPDDYTPDIVRMLVLQGADVLRVAEVVHTLERAYLDLVARQDQIDAEADRKAAPDVPRQGVHAGGGAA
jgi:hypothetical protein